MSDTRSAQMNSTSIAALRVYVDAVNGLDTNPGTADEPVQTLPAAQEAVRRLKLESEEPRPIEVILGGGTYQLREPLKFTHEDSGSAEAWVTWRAAEGAEVLISGGVPITGWMNAEGNIWSAPAPTLATEGKPFRLLRVGDKWAIRARHPNFDPANPYKGGWAFAQGDGKPRNLGAFDCGISSVYNQGGTVTWRLEVPADGKYHLWQRYAHHAMKDMGGHTAMKVDDKEWVHLNNLPDTGDWTKFCWAQVAEMEVTAGEHILSWTNKTNDGIILNAFTLTDDDNWDPNEHIWKPLAYSGPVDIKPVATGKHMVLWQCEPCETHERIDIVAPKDFTPTDQNCGIKYKPETFPHFANVQGAEVHIIIYLGWANAIVPVACLDEQQHKLIFTEPTTQRVIPGNRFFLENVREALDAPGEWFLDEAQWQVLYIPETDGFPQQPVVAPLLDRLIVLQGDPANDDWVEYLRFEGLRFSNTNYNLTNEYLFPRDATIWMLGARHCVIRECEFSWLGGYALLLSNGSERCVFIRNHVHDMGQGGVIMWSNWKDVDDNKPAHDCRILGNTIERLGLIYKHVAGVFLTHASGNHIAWNRIVDVPRYAISCLSHAKAPYLSYGNLIEYNELIRTNRETRDSGALHSVCYHFGNSQNVMRHNMIIDSGGMGTSQDGAILASSDEMPPFEATWTWGIYLEAYSSGTSVSGNIVKGTVRGGYSICGKNNCIKNNIFVKGSEHQSDIWVRPENPSVPFDFECNIFAHNIVCYSKSPNYSMIINVHPRKVTDSPTSLTTGFKEAFAECDHNLYHCTEYDIKTVNKKLFPAGNWAEWQNSGLDCNSKVADPLFMAPEQDDYRLKPNSPAWELGFKEIPVEKIGPKGLPNPNSPAWEREFKGIEGWNFWFKDFVIAAWCPPPVMDAEYAVYRRAGFNLVMTPRYECPARALELAAKHGLAVMIDTYTPNDQPWGGVADSYTYHPSHHPATLPELKWLHERYGQHEALAGYLLGDDFGVLPPELVETTKFLRCNAPHLFPWVCQNKMCAQSLADAGNPIQNPQIYPMLSYAQCSAEAQCQEFCRQLEVLRAGCRNYGLIPWPMFCVADVKNDSLIRFQVYASLAYGAQGIWYFTYRSVGCWSALEEKNGHDTEEEVEQHLSCTWKVAAQANRRVARWGPLLLGRTCEGIFSSGPPLVAGAAPELGQLIESMSDGLLAGVLTKPGVPPVVMVVNKRTEKEPGAVAEPEVQVRFAPGVTGLVLPEESGEQQIEGCVASLRLPGGGGQLILLGGSADRLPR